MAEEFCRLAEEREPRLLGFHIYVSEDRSSEVVVQIHPDAESMQHHLEVMGEKVRETFAFTDFESLEIHGEPNDPLKEWIPRVSQGIAFTHHPVHWGGFTRLQKARRAEATDPARRSTGHPQRRRAQARSAERLGDREAAEGEASRSRAGCSARAWRSRSSTTAP